MKRLNVVTGLIFLLLGGLSLLRHDLLAAAPAGLLGAGFLLSDLSYQPAGADQSVPPVRLPAWRRYGSMLFVVLALALFGHQIDHDFKAATQHPKTPTQPR